VGVSMPQETGEPLEMTYDLTYQVSHGPESLLRVLEVRSPRSPTVMAKRTATVGGAPHMRRRGGAIPPVVAVLTRPALRLRLSLLRRTSCGRG